MKGLLIIAAASLLVLSGCGRRETPKQEITRVVAEGAQAVGQKDGGKLCDIMSYQAKQWTIDYMQRVSPKDCRQAAQAAIEALSEENRDLISKTRPVRIEITGRSAKVWIAPRIVNGVPQPIPFTQTLSGWKAG